MAGPLDIVLLIFGGCCSNVFTLETLIKKENGSGILISFVQFVFAALLAYPQQFSITEPYMIKKSKVPMSRWAFIAIMFFVVNILNNLAFKYKISIVMHIIFRSFSAVTTMLAGAIRGRRYSNLQVFSVVLLTLGVLVSAWADSVAKGNQMSLEPKAPTSTFLKGVSVLVIAQITAAYMGAYVEDTYSTYTNADWRENLFYSHLLSLPMFLPLQATLRNSYSILSRTPPLDLEKFPLLISTPLPPFFRESFHHLTRNTPQGVLFLLINAVTQLACISGVNLLSAKSSAVTVTIVLNIRKLVSFILSTIIFGHHLSGMMLVGAALVFGSGALYGWETSWRLPRQRSRVAMASVSVDKSK